MDSTAAYATWVQGYTLTFYANLPFGQVSCKFYLPSKQFACPVMQMTCDEGVSLWSVCGFRASVNHILTAPLRHLVVWASRATISVEPWGV